MSERLESIAARVHAPFVVLGNVRRVGVNITDPADKKWCIDNDVLLVNLRVGAPDA